MTDEQHMHLDEIPQITIKMIHFLEILKTFPDISKLLEKTCGHCAASIFHDLELKDLDNLVAITKKAIAVRYKVLEKSL